MIDKILVIKNSIKNCSLFWQQPQSHQLYFKFTLSYKTYLGISLYDYIISINLKPPFHLPQALIKQANIHLNDRLRLFGS